MTAKGGRLSLLRNASGGPDVPPSPHLGYLRAETPISDSEAGAEEIRAPAIRRPLPAPSALSSSALRRNPSDEGIAGVVQDTGPVSSASESKQQDSTQEPREKTGTQPQQAAEDAETDELVRRSREAAQVTEEQLKLPRDDVWIGRGRQKYALLLCEDDKEFAADVPRVWLRLLREKTAPEDWRIYRTAERGELPTIDDDLHGVLIPGSSHSCYEDLEWIARLKDFVRAAYIPLRDDHRSPQHSKKPQIVGSCFGAQLIAEALGGYVTRNPRGRYIVQAQEIFIQEAFARQPFADGIILKTLRGARFQPAPKKWSSKDDTSSLPFMRITETHGDSVLSLPLDSQVLGTSTNITNEVFLVGKNILCYQGHPEFTTPRGRLLKKVVGYVFPPDLPKEELDAAKRTFKKPLHSYGLIEVTRRFLKRHYRDNVDMLHSGAVPIAPPVVLPASEEGAAILQEEGISAEGDNGNNDNAKTKALGTLLAGPALLLSSAPASSSAFAPASSSAFASAGSGSSASGSTTSDDELLHRELEEHEVEDWKADTGTSDDEQTAVSSIFGGNEEADRREPVKAFTGLIGSNATARRKAKWRARIKAAKQARKAAAVDALSAAAARIAGGGAGGLAEGDIESGSIGGVGGILETVPEGSSLGEGGYEEAELRELGKESGFSGGEASAGAGSSGSEEEEKGGNGEERGGVGGGEGGSCGLNEGPCFIETPPRHVMN